MTIRRRALAALAAITVSASGLLTLTASPAAAATCASGVPGDVNGDGYAETAVSSRHPESVHVFYGHPKGIQLDARGSALDDQQLTQATTGLPSSSGSGFGRASTFGDFNGDGCADLALATPTAVTVLFGTPRGLKTTGVQQLVPVGSPFDQWFLSGFGFDLGSGDLTGDGVDDLVVGAGAAIDTGSDGGSSALVVYTGSSTGLSTATSRRIPVTEDDLGYFGVGLNGFAVGDFDGNGTFELAVGSRTIAVLTFGTDRLQSVRKDVVDDRGQGLVAGDTNGDGCDDLAFTKNSFYNDVASVVLLFGSGSGLGPDGSREWVSSDLGLPKDYDGFQLAMGPLDAGPTADLAIAAPGAPVRSATQAGAVIVLFGGPNGPTIDRQRRLTEATSGVPGSAETGDAFGGAVSTAYVQGRGQASLIVGAPGESSGSVRRAGRLYVFPRGAAGPKASGSRAISLDTAGVKGRAAKNSRFGIDVGR